MGKAIFAAIVTLIAGYLGMVVGLESLGGWVEFGVLVAVCVMGAFITWTVIKSMNGLGPAKATLLIVVTQILVSYLVEVFGLFGVERVGFEWKKLIGAAVAIAGIVIFRW